ncbi:hypothetical protein B296_00033245 [Ensete ventricosum]|uniref:GS catalytic domain-containing protein n=1 Tax=Ensete ventricosum TaxID=4639 RepID=A0A427ABH2_ENSVE|nr:hypothetical protein B296_00033245 [Ensete ventricosum]
MDRVTGMVQVVTPITGNIFHPWHSSMTQVAVMLSRKLKPSKEFQGCLEKVDQRSYPREKLVEIAYMGNQKKLCMLSSAPDLYACYCSTKSMREEGGYEVIKKAILNLSLRHMDHISAYGEGNERRLTGKHETANINTFSWVDNRNQLTIIFDLQLLSFQMLNCCMFDHLFVPNLGYLEDRRPASNMDPYVVTSLLAESTILWQPTLEAEARAAKELQLQV